MRVLSWVAATSLVALSGCASVPMASVDLDAQGKRFQEPPAGKAALYVYRESSFNAAFSINVSLGQRVLGALGADTWFLIDVEPGQYDVRCNAENSDSKMVAIAAGETRFVEVAARLGMSQPRCAVFEVNSSQGQKAITNGKRAQEIR